MSQEDLRKKVDLAFLSAFYGGLLTEKQQRVLSLHCEEDLSLAEIASEVGISRQAVHETISRAASRLSELEASLGVAKRFRGMESGLQEALSALKQRDYLRAEQLLEKLSYFIEFVICRKVDLWNHTKNLTFINCNSYVVKLSINSKWKSNKDYSIYGFCMISYSK